MMNPKENSVEEVQPVIDHVHNNIDRLNHDSLEMIFLNLPISDKITAEQVCRKWYGVSQFPWYNETKYKCGHSIDGRFDQLLTQTYVKKILLKCINLRDLSLSKICNSSIMPIVGEHCQKLTRLEFVANEELKIDNNDYIQAFTKLNKIKIIKIEILPLQDEDNIKFNPEVLNNLPEGIEEIEFLEIHNYGQESKTPVFFNLKKFKNLHSLTLKGCILDRIVQELSEKTTLIYLDLQDSWLVMTNFSFDQLVNLKHINIFNTDSDSIKKFTRDSIFNTCKNLRYLNLRLWFVYDSVEIFSENWINLKNLEYLTISWKITDDLVKKIVKYCKNLKYLDISTSYKSDCLNDYIITETALKKLTELKNLECLKLPPMAELSDESVTAISNNYKKLKQLEIASCNTIEYDNDADSPGFDFDKISKLKYLEHLNLSHIFGLQNSSLIFIANQCKNLTSLDITHCRSITKEALIVLTNLKKLQRLNVSHIKNVSNSFIGKLKRLKYLDCRYCTKITDSAIIRFIKRCPALEHLYLCKTNLTIETIIKADQATKNRTNGIILHIYFHDLLKKLEIVSMPKIESMWLILSSDCKKPLCKEV